jgi:glycosyltransferase involved in cell wall biosynthesis
MPALIDFGIYLRQKRLHLRYLVGKFVFRLRYWGCELLKPSYYLRRLHDLLLAFHGMELGVLCQYSPRPIRSSQLPLSSREITTLPTIAIVTPSYNQSGLIPYTIESVLGQDYPHLEYGIVDGASTDGTPEIIANYLARLAYYVSEPDEGQADAILKGFSNMKGEIMAYLNSDDVLMPGALQFVGGFFAQHPEIDVIYGHRIVIDEAGQEVGRWILPPHDAEAIRHFDYVPQETLFWRRTLYDRVGGIDPLFRFAMDWDLLLRFLSAGARFYRTPYFLSCFRIHSKQKTFTLLNSVGECEKARLIAREHPNGCNLERARELENSYRMRSSICAAFLKWGMRY